MDEELPSEEEALSMVSQYFISTALREIRSAPPPARVFSPGERVRIIEVIGCRNSQFRDSIGIVAEHYFNVSVWVELDGGGRKIILSSPEELELIELVAEEPAAKQEPIEIQRQEPIENSTAVEVQAHEAPIIETVETSGVEVEPLHEPSLESKFGRIVYPCLAQKAIAPAAKHSPGVEVDRVQQPIIEMVETSPAVSVEQAQEPIALAPEIPPGVDVDPVSEPIGENFTEWVDSEPPNPNDYEFWEEFEERYQEWVAHQQPISPAVKNSNGVEVDRVSEPIAEAAETNPGVESDWHPIVRVVTLSDKFCARGRHSLRTSTIKRTPTGN